MLTYSPIIIKNIFRSSEGSADSLEYTRLWIELINQLEKNKELLSAAANRI